MVKLMNIELEGNSSDSSVLGSRIVMYVGFANQFGFCLERNFKFRLSQELREHNW